MAFSTTTHIIVTEVPPGFLKRRVIRSHFSQFGGISRLTIQNDHCIVTFENPGEAQDAVLNGTEWKGMPIKIDFTSNHDPFGTDDSIINEELNRYAEEPAALVKKRSKSKYESRSSDKPPKKIGRIDLTKDDDNSSQGPSRSKTCKKHREHHSSTTKFLEKIRSRSPEHETKSKSRLSFEKKSVSPFRDVMTGIEYSRDDSREKSRPMKSIFEEVSDSYMKEEDEGKSPLRLLEEESRESSMVVEKDKSDGKAILSFFNVQFKEKEQSPMIIDDVKPEFKFGQKLFASEKIGRDSSPVNPEIFKLEGKSAIRSSDDKKKMKESSLIVLDNIKAENKPVLRIIDAKKRDRESPPMTNEEKKFDEKISLKASEESKVSLKTNDPPFYTKPATTLKEKLDLLEERDKLIRLMPETSGMESVLQGTCPDMCPEKERILRELRNMVAPYEALPDGKMDHGKAVKEYTRSSADQGKPLPHELRPEPVLTMTMSYLINCIISRIDEVGEESLHNWYDFCWGRLRAIRKDIIQQDLCDRNTVRILEQCARFHIACYDRLWGLSKSLFDDKLNTETLNNCLTSLMKFYKDLRRDKIICPHEAEFNSYLILLNMNNAGFLISEYRKYSLSLKESPLIKQAVKLHLAYHNNMFSTYFKLTKNTSYLNSCLAQRFFQHVRIEALNTIVKSHCTPNKLSTITAEFLMGMLKLDSIDDCVNFCESTGLTYAEDEKSFKIFRNDFYISEDIYNIESPSSLILKKRVAIAEAVTGNERTFPIYLKHVVHESFTSDGLLNESALDASDQEEKMLRDNVERDLLMNHLKGTLLQKKEKNVSEDMVSSTHNMEVEEVQPVFKRSSPSCEIKIQSMAEPPSASKDNGYKTEDRTDSVGSAVANHIQFVEKISLPEPSIPNVSLPFQSFSFKLPETFMTSNLNVETTPNKIVSPEISGLVSSEALNIRPPKVSNVLGSMSEKSQSIYTTPQLKAVSPKSKIFPTVAPQLSTLSSVKNKSTIPKSSSTEKKMVKKAPSSFSVENVKSEEKKLHKTSRSKPYASRNSQPDDRKSRTKWEKSFSRKTELENKLPKYHKESPPINKLRKKLSENMKKISARKYFKLWKEKASKLKSLKELESMVLQDLPTKDYLALWGKPNVKRSLNLSRHIASRKNSGVMVHLILHSDIIGKIDKDSKNIGKSVINALGEKAVKMADVWGNIAQPNPVFWKLVFALPHPPSEGTTFTMKLRSWCKAAFYQGQGTDLSSVEIHISDYGVPVIIKICVVEGLEELCSCANLSALVLVRARSWETTLETQNRLEKFVSLSNHPVPVAVLNVGPRADNIMDVKDNKNISCFIQSSWEDSKATGDILRKLARNSCLFNLRIKPFSNLLDCTAEKLFDMIGQDSFFNDDLSQSITNPNKILLIYNQLILKLEQEIKECQVHNYFGTAYEFKNDLEKINNSFVFPDNYKDSNFVESLALRCRKCKLPPLKLHFEHSKDLLSFLTNYCDDIGCQNILRTLLRFLNLPDEDSDIKLSDHLKSVQWLPFIEIIVKEVFMSHLLTFKVAYRDNIVNDIFNSHFWLEA